MTQRSEPKTSSEDPPRAGDVRALAHFDPAEERVLRRGLSASTIVHVCIASTLLAYGAEISALQAKDVALTRTPVAPIKASFVFEEKPEPELKPHLVPEKVAQAQTPEPPVEKPKRVRPRKKAKKKIAATAPRARTPVKVTPKQIAASAPAAVAPPSESSEASTASVPSATEDVAQGPATPQAPAAPTGVASSIDKPGLLRAYVKTLSKAVRKRRAYPRAAKLAGLEGRAVVRIVLNESGGIVAIELASSSGHDILDRAALEAARSVGRLPAAPSALNWGTRAIKVPFSFKVTS